MFPDLWSCGSGTMMGGGGGEEGKDLTQGIQGMIHWYCLRKYEKI